MNTPGRSARRKAAHQVRGFMGNSRRSVIERKSPDARAWLLVQLARVTTSAVSRWWAMAAHQHVAVAATWRMLNVARMS